MVKGWRRMNGGVKLRREIEMETYEWRRGINEGKREEARWT